MAHSQQRQQRQPDAPTKSERVSQSAGKSKGKGNNSNELEHRCYGSGAGWASLPSLLSCYLSNNASESL